MLLYDYVVHHPESNSLGVGQLKLLNQSVTQSIQEATALSFQALSMADNKIFSRSIIHRVTINQI